MMTRPDEKRLCRMHDLGPVGEVELACMGVIIADRLHQVAPILSQIGSKNGSGGGNVVAGLVDQPGAHPIGRV
jgi:hypothetical protein